MSHTFCAGYLDNGHSGTAQYVGTEITHYQLGTTTTSYIKILQVKTAEGQSHRILPIISLITSVYGIKVTKTRTSGK